MTPELSLPSETFQWYSGALEQKVIFWICAAFLTSMVPACAMLLFRVSAPYGRYNQGAEKQQQSAVLRALSVCDVNPRVAWFLQECPTLVAAALCWPLGREECTGSLGNRLGMLCFVAHYFYRSVIHPMRIRGSKPIPLPVMLLAMVFCAANGYIQCRTLTRYVVVPSDSWTLLPGILVWCAGLWVNVDADRILRSLRKPGETGYKIPYGGMFAYVSGANYFGETVEWVGFALAVGGALPACTFALCTPLNVGPRAISHHKWYLDKFKDEYPRERRAFIPFLL